MNKEEDKKDRKERGRVNDNEKQQKKDLENTKGEDKRSRQLVIQDFGCVFFKNSRVTKALT